MSEVRRHQWVTSDTTLTSNKRKTGNVFLICNLYSTGILSIVKIWENKKIIFILKLLSSKKTSQSVRSYPIWRYVSRYIWSEWPHRSAVWSPYCLPLFLPIVIHIVLARRSHCRAPGSSIVRFHLASALVLAFVLNHKRISEIPRSWSSLKIS